MGKLTSTAPINPLVSATSSYGASQRIWNMIGISWEYHRDMIGISYLEDIPRLVFFLVNVTIVRSSIYRWEKLLNGDKRSSSRETLAVMSYMSYKISDIYIRIYIYIHR